MANNPSAQTTIASLTNDEVFRSQSITLSGVSKEYGRGTMLAWLNIQLGDLSAYSGVKDVTSSQQQQLAIMIAQKYYYLTINELMKFFVDFKSGEYGQFYGAFDPIKVMTALRDFVDRRNFTLDRLDFEEAKKRRKEELKTAVSYEEYLKQRSRRTT